MLRLGRALSTRSKKRSFDPTSVKNLVSWFDFSDKSSMYTDAGTTNITTPGQTVYRIDNKAYTNQKNNTIAIGKYVEQSAAANRPSWLAKGCANFDGSNDFLLATNVIGNVATNKLSDTTLNGIDMTIFFVAQADGTTVSGDEYLMHLNGSSVNDRMSAYIDNSTNDRWQWHLQNDSARTNTVMNCGQNLTTNSELWTIHLDHVVTSSIYRNNNTSDGTASGPSDNHDIDLSVNNANIRFVLGGKGAANYFDGKIYEFIMYDRALTTREQKMVNTYLMKKFK